MATASSSSAPYAYEGARLRLARISAAAGSPLRHALHEVAKVVAESLNVNRVSVWRFIDGHKSIRCEFLYQPASRTVSEGAILHAIDFPNYFRTLQTRRVVPVVDVDGDVFTEEFRGPYFRPLGITSMLDAPIYRTGDVVGIVCHEQIGPVRHWTTEDCEFAATVADVIARLYEEADRLQAEVQRDTYEAQIVDLQRLSAMGRLAAGMAHDFNNVLQAILAYAQVITSTAQGQTKITDLVDGLVKATGRGTDLVRELRMLGHDQPCRPRVIELAELIGSIGDMLSKAAGPDVLVQIVIPAPIGAVFVDPAHMERVILNLVMNARDAMPSGGMITITLHEATRAGRGRDDSKYVVLNVADTGVGIDAETQTRMFEPLFTTKGAKGSGLGLAIVKQVVASAGGFIEVESATGRGTSIRIQLPRIG